MPACIDLNKVHLRRQHGDLLAVYTWFDGDRALVLMPAYRKKAPWFVVKENAAYLYDDPRYMAKRCPEAVRFMGLEDNKANWVRVATIIHEGLPDLIRMPSEPDWEALKAQEVGTLTLRAEGEVVHQEALTLKPDQGAQYVPA